MARFKGTMTGNRGEVSRLGTVKSGIEAKINGWTSGVKVCSGLTPEKRDRFDIYATSGSRGEFLDRFIGTVEETSGGFAFIPAGIR